ncbi:hypothetical protein GIB67_033993 [Kingdonia uniflora]|uniref:Uncharacterized protein n=1 Tax=Kingdonia uniflora TaxID=39325 RepID=A0A7J7M6A0_9MAGN|nr:hypothetical protein GIB67_033993 [Kingdonia uniflora]
MNKLTRRTKRRRVKPRRAPPMLKITLLGVQTTFFIKFVKNYTILSPPEQGEKHWGEVC